MDLLRIADAVVQTLNDATLSQPVEAVRLFLPQFELPEMATLRVTVVPRDQETKALTRGSREQICKVDVGVQKKLELGDLLAIDPLAGLANEIAELFLGQRLLTIPGALCVTANINPVAATEHLETLRQFTAVVALTFRLVT